MQSAYRQTQNNNVILLLTLNCILQVMRTHELNPVLWKVVVLVDSFYPDIGTRPMGDIDFAIAPNEMKTIIDIFKSLGFGLQPDAETSDAVYFTNQTGVVCDVHHRVRLFEGKESINLTIDLKPQRMSVPTMRLLEPNAMLVHLIVHMDGHRSETGFMLCWILDLVFVLRKWGTLLVLKQIEKLMPAHKHMASLFRILHFLKNEFGEKIPECLLKTAKKYEPLTLDEILRQQRLASWGLPHLRGWLRLVASQLGFRLKNKRPPLQISDLLFFSKDIIRNRQMGINLGKKYNY